MCVSLGSKAVAEISSLESLLALCVALSLSLFVCMSLSLSLSQRDLRRSSSVENMGFVRSLKCGQHARDEEEVG